MTLKLNVVANYASQIYVTAVGIAVVPLYIKLMGSETYGLIGFFAMLQAWFALLDLGLGPTIARESARFKGGAIGVLEYRRLVRSLEGVFLIVALAGGTLLFILADSISSKWLNSNQLPKGDVAQAIQLMAVIIALRWMCGLYRGVISGSEQLVRLSILNVIFATLRFILILPILISFSASSFVFFTYQLAVAVIEAMLITFYAYRLLPELSADHKIKWEWAPLKPLMKFSLSIAFTSTVWVIVTQADKLVLSKILSLSDYGFFTVAVLVASGISILSGPISAAIMPRMARLQAEGQYEQLLLVYRKATQVVMMIVVPATVTLALFSEQVLWAWTGDNILVEKSAPVLKLYAIGYGIMAAAAFPYYLQYSKGDLKLHLIGNLLFLIFLIPSAIWSSLSFGAVGAGWAWLLSNLAYFLFWPPLVHKKFAPKLHLNWLFNDVFKYVFVGLFVMFPFSIFVKDELSLDRFRLSFQLACMIVVLLLSSVGVFKLFGKYRVKI